MEQTRVLVVDDESGVTTLCKMNLEKTGRYAVSTVNQPATALQEARDFKPDVIVLDVIMPGKDGGEVLADLQADEQLKDIPVLFLTATLTDRGVDARKGTIHGYPLMAKPVEPKKLMQRIDDLVEANR
jgi:CheY-like chemotaxis protein